MKNLAILILFTWGLITSFGQSVPRVNTVPVVATNNGPHLVTATGSTTGRTTQDRFNDEKNVLDWGLVGDGVTENDTAFETMIGTVGSKAKIVFPNPKGTNVFLFDSVNISNDVRIVGLGLPTIKHKANSSGHMWRFVTEQTHSIEGLYFDGNESNQNSTTNWYSLLYTFADGLEIKNNVFTEYMKSAILDFQSTGSLFIDKNKFFNGHQLATNELQANCAIWFAPGVTNARPWLHVNGNIFTNETRTTRRLPGGIFTAGSDGNNSFNYITIKDNWGDNVGDDHVIGPSHYGIAAVDIYEDSLSGVVSGNFFTNGWYHIYKIQNSANMTISDNFGHSSGTIVYSYTPGERSQTTEYWNAYFRDNTALGGTTQTLGFYLNAGDAGGFRNVVIDGFTATNIDRGMQIEGYISDGTPSGYGPVKLENMNIHAVGNYALQVRGMIGELSISDSLLECTNVGTAFTMIETNNQATLKLNHNTFRSYGTGWAARIWGVNQIIADGNKFNASGGGESVELQDDADGNNIAKLFWNHNNVIVAGSTDVTAADIDMGYFGNGTTTTWYPTGFQEITSGAAGGYFKEFRYDTAAAALLGRIRNDDAAGGALLNFRAGGSTDVIGTIASYATNFADAQKAGWFHLNAENAAGTDGIALNAENSGQKIRMRAGDNTTRFEIDGGGARFPQLTASRVLVLDASRNAAISTADTNDLHYISTVTSDVQTQLNNKQPLDSDLTTIANNNPGNSYYFGTDSGGTKGFYVFPGAATHTNTVTIACSDLTTALTTGNGKAYWRAPFNCTVVDVRASLLTASSSGAVTIDVNEGGASIFTTTLTIDASETTSTSAATPAVIGGAGPGLDNDDEITIDIDGAGTNAAGLLVTIYYVRTS